MSVSIGQIEFFLVILVRVSAFVYTAPFFNTSNVPRRVKAGMSILLAFAINGSLTYEQLQYSGVVGFAILVMKEAVAGVCMGFFANLANYILGFVGQRIDMDMGLSMATEYNVSLGGDSTVTGSLYSYAVLLILMVTNMHLYIVQAIIESFQLIPVGGVVINTEIYKVMLLFLADYFVIGFRIVLPVFAAILIVDTILGILAKAAPQMNMFAVGLQLKIGVGLFMLYFMVRMLPGVSELIFTEMFDMLRYSVGYLGGS